MNNSILKLIIQIMMSSYINIDNQILEKLLKINTTHVINYDGKGKQKFIVSHAIRQIIPQIIDYDSPSNSIDYHQITVLLLEIVKKQQKEIEKTNDLINNLNNVINKNVSNINDNINDNPPNYEG